jgi:hypothetical protein
MCALFRNKYRIGSKRCHGYDYSSPGNYFVTICTRNRIQYFGNVVNGKMILSELGFCLKNEWIDFEWQPRFHDHIIRTNTELFRIRKYIIENPEKWIGDF